MKRLLSLILSLLILTSLLPPVIQAKSYGSAQAAIDDANRFLKDNLGIQGYYKTKAKGRNIIEEYAKDGVKGLSGKSVFVYGTKEAASESVTPSYRKSVKKVNGVDVYRAFGFARDGSVFSNPSFPKDNEGSEDTNKKWVKEPWGPGKNKVLQTESGQIEEIRMTSGVLDYVKDWIKDPSFDLDVIVNATGDPGFIANQALKIPTGLKDNFHDFLYVIQPPTEHVWGLGIAFYYWDDNGSPHLNYRSFRLQPYGGDIAAEYEHGAEPPESAAKGTDITVGVQVTSKFGTDITDVPYRWVITMPDGTPLMPSVGDEEKDALAFTGDSPVQSGVLSFTEENNKEAWLYASFKMPEDSNVRVRFEVNKDGTDPEEAILENNVLESVIEKEVPPPEEIIVPIDIGDSRGRLKAEERGNEKFDVLEGIPVTEELYTQIDAKEYLSELICTPKTGNKEETITVSRTYKKTWKDPDTTAPCTDCTDGSIDDPENPGTSIDCSCTDGIKTISGSWHYNVPQEITKTYTVKRSYSYYEITQFAMYELAGARVDNDVLADGGVDIGVNTGSYIGPEIVEFIYSTELNDHIIVDPFVETMQGGSVLTLPTVDYAGSNVDETTVDWGTEVEAAFGQFHMKNDSLIINFRKIGVPESETEKTIVQAKKDDRDSGNAPLPSEIPQSQVTNKNALYKKDLAVLRETLNGTYETTGTVTYRRLAKNINPTKNELVTSDIDGINPVIVHTPVVCNSGVKDYDSQQLGAKEEKRSDLILGEDASLVFRTDGVMHREIKGYGARSYNKYVESKYVRFPFDTYIEDTSDYVFVPGNEWHQIDKSWDYVSIKVPVWVDEKDYIVNFKTVAINAPDDIGAPDADGSGQEYMANKGINNYVAYRDSKVRVVGQVRNFRITDIGDYPLWENVFRKKTGSSSHTGKNYTVGNALGGNPEPYTLSIMEGSHPKQSDRGAIKTGYSFKFTLETVGEYFEDNDYIRIKPSFYYVNKDGTGRKAVNIFYNEYFNGKDNILVRIGSAKDKDNKHVIVNTDIYRNMPGNDIKSTCQLRGITEKQFKGVKTDIGSYDEISLSKDMRLFIGNPVSSQFAVGSEEAKREQKSEQRWYGEYKLPDKLYVTTLSESDMVNHPEAQDGIDGRESFWLKDGYIIVNFRIETLQDVGEGSNIPVLGYWHANDNRWEAEGFSYQQEDHYGKKFSLRNGDVVFYHAGKKSSDDYKVGGNR